MRDTDPDCRRFATRLRMWLVRAIDRLVPGSCGAEWYAWAMGYIEERPGLRNPECSDAKPGEPCWCGKYGWPPEWKGEDASAGPDPWDSSEAIPADPSPPNAGGRGR